MPAGALLGGQVGGLLMAKLGRKGGLMVCATLFSLSLLLLTAASNVAMLYIGRIFCGICTGKLQDIFLIIISFLSYRHNFNY